MLPQQCPQCKYLLPLGEPLPAVCPICGKSLETLLPRRSETRRKEADPAIGGRRQRWINVAVAVLAIGVACLVAVKWAGDWLPQAGDWFAKALDDSGLVAKDEQPAEETTAKTAGKTSDTKTMAAKGESTKTAHDGSPPGKTGISAAGDEPAKPVEPERPSPVLPNEPVAEEFHAPAPPAGEPVRLNDPAGQHEVAAVDGQQRITLEGRIRTLRIGSINGETAVDASGLDAREVVVANGVNGQATIKLRAPDGAVEIQGGGLNGATTLHIDAPGGRVVFAPGAQINGEAKVAITAREVVFGGTIAGASRIDVALTGAGKIKCGDLIGAARLYYRKADKSAADPAVEHGNIHPGAELKMVE